MIVFCSQVWDKPITGTTQHFTGPEHYSALAQADKYYMTVATQQVSGTSPTLTVKLQHSSDGVNWTDKATLLNAQQIASDTVYDGSDTGTSTVAGCFVRLSLQLGGTSPSAWLDVRLTGRSE